MTLDKRLIFTVSPGRSGTNYLTHLLTGLPGVRAEHEPVPNFRHIMPRARYEPDLALPFLKRKKLPAIAAVEEKIYIETSHYIAKGFLDHILNFGLVPDLILLKRDPRKVASSWFSIGGGMRELRAGEHYQHMLGPHEANFLPAKHYEKWNDYQLCYWYALESFFRMRHYAGLISARGGKIFETDLDALTGGGDYARLLGWLGMPEEIIRARVADTPYREQRVNELTEFKRRWALEKKLASLDLPPLEAQVLKDCGLAAPPEVESRTLEVKEKSSPLSILHRPPSIFVCIASFRDPECQWTVKDLFEKATHPERINVGICWQYDPEEDKQCFVAEPPRPEQVRVVQFHHKDSQGANWARVQALSLMQGEDYVLQIDSHMRFEPGWDDTLIDMLSRCPSPKAVISAYLHKYDPPDDRNYGKGQLLRIRVRRLGGDNDPQMLHLTGVFIPASDERAGLYPSPFYIANFMFTRASTLQEVPIDPHIHFFGDEISYAARLWTHGYDIFQPDGIVLFHDWARKSIGYLRHYRRVGTAVGKHSFERLSHLLGFATAKDPQALAEIERYGLGTARALEGLWALAGIEWNTRTISADALEGRWAASSFPPPLWGRVREGGNYQPVRPLTDPPLPALPHRGGGGNRKIFVNIASYRDRECQWTVKDLFEKATYPDRIHVGICWQFDAKEDADCFQVSTRPEQVSMMPVDWREGEGVCWARHQVQQLYNGEDYNLQTDSHMRFVPGWDESMIEELALCEADKPLVTCSMGIYTPPNELEANPKPTVRRVRQFQADGNIRGQGEYIDRVPDKPLNGAFVAGGFLFSRGEVVTEVPYDPYLYFDQEEITYAARLYTHGWDVFSGRRPLMYHYYNKSSAESVRPLHWTDLRKEDDKKISFLQSRGLKRFNHMTGFQLSNDPEVIKELDIYGWGKARSLQQFEEYCGIDFKRKFASEKAMRALFIKDLHKYTKGLHIPELDAVKKEMPKQSAGGLKMLEKGDFVPMFEAKDTTGTTRAIEMYGGQHCMVFFLPADNSAYVTPFFKTLQQRFSEAAHKNIWQIFILDGTAEQLAALKEKIGTPHALWADPEQKLAQAFGIIKAAGKPMPPVGYVLSNNLRISHVRFNLGPEQLAAAIVEDCQKDVANYKAQNYERRIVSQLPPALIIPDAFTPELCKKCIDAFNSGHQFDGTVGVEDKAGYRPNAKMRTDHIVSGALLDEIDEKFSRSVFPEIKKIFGFEVKYRELYKVGLYKGEKGGFFKQHRDNFETPLSYRRVAMTLQLNDDYEGGGLRFPEYDENIYRPKAGGAIAFSCATVHEARPVTSGERYILVCFFHGEEEEAFRRFHLAGKGAPLKINDYTPKLRPEPEVAQSRDYLREWRKKWVKFE